MNSDPLLVIEGTEQIALVEGDCVEKLRLLPDGIVDALITDPPYGLEFMGEDWDRLGDTRQPGDKTFHEGSGPFSRSTVRHGGYPKYGQGRASAPGIGDRDTEWPSSRGWNEKRCKKCGHLSHGGSPCKCENPEFIAADDRWQRMQDWHYRWAVEAYRVLKPGAHAIVFSGTRTSHRMVSAMEDAGFEVRNTFAWIFSQGFPKSLNIAKKAAESDPDLAEEYDGWGTDVKPAYEPATLFRKPMVGTVVKNIQKYGTGGLNLEASRVPLNGETPPTGSAKGGDSLYGQVRTSSGSLEKNVTPSAGRFPSNLLLSHDSRCVVVGTEQIKGDSRAGNGEKGRRPSGFVNIGTAAGDTEPNADVYGNTERVLYACVYGCPIRLLDDQSGVLKSGKVKKGGFVGEVTASVALGKKRRMIREETIVGDQGGASRFFINFEPELPPLYYCAKAPKSERAAILQCSNYCTENRKVVIGKTPQSCHVCGEEIELIRHPTVKPLNLMRYLVRMIAPPGGVVLDCFAGTGTTAVAAQKEGFRIILMEEKADYCKLIEARIKEIEPPAAAPSTDDSQPELSFGSTAPKI